MNPRIRRILKGALYPLFYSMMLMLFLVWTFPYERLKELTRGRRVDAEMLREFVLGLRLPAEAEKRLLELTPATYTGLASALVAHLDS